MAEEVPSKTIGVQLSSIKYTERRSVRAIIHKDNGEVIIIHVKKGDYYKLPGGGIENDEDYNMALQREAMEETGCKIEIVGKCIGTVEEWRFDLHQISYCYTAKLTEDTGKVDLTEEELEDGFEHQWVPISSVLFKMKEIQPTSEFGKFVKERDVFFMETHLANS